MIRLPLVAVPLSVLLFLVLAVVAGCGDEERTPRPVTADAPATADATPAAPVTADAAEIRDAEALYSIRLMSPELALKATQAALAACREKGFAATVAVVDRGGTVQALLRDRFAGPHTPDTAQRKAWTAITFRADTQDLVDATQSGPQAAARLLPGVVMLGGGVRIESAGSLVGAIGVSGAPTGSDDDACARAGIRAIQEALVF
jgi:uncharacterized protein GlcG (DUF336 family)